jgi:hypothetical protein
MSTLIGNVSYVDTGSVSIAINDDNVLNNVQVNQIVSIRSTKVNEEIIGLISKIIRKTSSDVLSDDDFPAVVENLMKVNLIGVIHLKDGIEKNIFKRSLNTIPSIGTDCFLLQGQELSDFMNIISSNSQTPLIIGKYSISDESDTKLDGNKFFQRHAVIVGGTGSGKSWAVANILEKASKLSSINSIIFDIHGEYEPLSKLDNAVSLKIAGPADIATTDNVIFLPYWLLSYEEIEAMLLDRSDTNAPNQSRALFDLIIKYKKSVLTEQKKDDVLDNFTIESPIPYKLGDVLSELNDLDIEMVPGAKTEKQGPLHGKLTRFIQRLKSKQMDKRLNFIFNIDELLLKYEWLDSLMEKLMGAGKNGLKIINFSEVPSDMLPLITGLMARIIFSTQQWMDSNKRHPIVLFCDEAHLYLPSSPNDSIDENGIKNFERIAKEGRKYGVSLVVISQRPADVNKTILSQCGNFIAMRLTNPDDQNIIRKLFPDNIGDFADLLPILDIGEALIVGDASLLPTRVKISPPSIKPNSATIDFWDVWAKDNVEAGIKQAVDSLRKQQR